MILPAPITTFVDAIDALARDVDDLDVRDRAHDLLGAIAVVDLDPDIAQAVAEALGTPARRDVATELFGEAITTCEADVDEVLSGEPVDLSGLTWVPDGLLEPYRAALRARDLAHRVSRLAAGLGLDVPGFGRALDAALRARLVGSALLDVERSLLPRATLPGSVGDGLDEARWWAVAQDDDAEVSEREAAEFGDWLAARATADGRVALSAAELAAVHAHPHSDELMAEVGHLIDASAEAPTAAEWREAVRELRPMRTAPQRRTVARVASGLRLAAADSGALALHVTRGALALFRFGVQRLWVEPGLGVVAFGERVGLPHAVGRDRDAAPAWLLIAEPGVAGVWAVVAPERIGLLGPDGARVVMVDAAELGLCVEFEATDLAGAVFARQVDGDGGVGEGTVSFLESAGEAVARSILEHVAGDAVDVARSELERLLPSLAPAERAALEGLVAVLDGLVA